MQYGILHKNILEKLYILYNIENSLPQRKERAPRKRQIKESVFLYTLFKYFYTGLLFTEALLHPAPDQTESQGY